MSSESAQVAPRRRVRIGTMVWGAILVGISVFALIVLLGGIVGTSAVLWSVVGFGAFLVLAAVVTAIARAATGRGDAADAADAADATGSGHPPIG